MQGFLKGRRWIGRGSPRFAKRERVDEDLERVAPTANFEDVAITRYRDRHRSTACRGFRGPIASSPFEFLSAGDAEYQPDRRNVGQLDTAGVMPPSPHGRQNSSGPANAGQLQRRA